VGKEALIAVEERLRAALRSAPIAVLGFDALSAAAATRWS
jgi:hypothetical protein